MKYIRTKDGIYEVIFDKENRVFAHAGSKCGNVYGNKIEFAKDGYDGDMEYGVINRWNEVIIKQANTIEELCDGFIFKDTHANKLHFLDKNSGISLLGASLFEETLRGFIETDKGLIYVAKMNDKGELELL